MSAIGFRIKSEFERPDKSLVEGFSGIPVANLADCMNRVSCVDASIYPLNSAPLLGVAFTVRAVGGDNLLFHKALDMAKPGDVLVIAGGGNMERAYCGEIMVRYAINCGLAGIIVDGCIRDAETLKELRFPVFCKGITPNGPYKNGPGEIGYPIAFAGQVVFPGDIILGDSDGIAIVRPEDAKGLSAEAREITEKEGKILTDLANGKGMDRAWIDQALSQKGCKII